MSASATPLEMTDADTISDADTDDAGAKRKRPGRLKIVVSPPEQGGEDEENDSHDEDDGDFDADLMEENNGQLSPVVKDFLDGLDWGSMNADVDAELAEFLDSESDDGGDEKAADGGNGLSAGSKRKLDDGEGDLGELEATKKKARTREDNGSLPTPQVTDDGNAKDGGRNDDYADDDELEADMLAELEADDEDAGGD
jgi:hypothetical protein